MVIFASHFSVPGMHDASSNIKSLDNNVMGTFILGGFRNSSKLHNLKNNHIISKEKKKLFYLK